MWICGILRSAVKVKSVWWCLMFAWICVTLGCYVSLCESSSTFHDSLHSCVGDWVYLLVCMHVLCVAPCLLWPASYSSLNNRTAHNYSPPCIQEQMAHTDPEMALSVKLGSYCICLLLSVCVCVGARTPSTFPLTLKLCVPVYSLSILLWSIE